MLKITRMAIYFYSWRNVPEKQRTKCSMKVRHLPGKSIHNFFPPFSFLISLLVSFLHSLLCIWAPLSFNTAMGTVFCFK